MNYYTFWTFTLMCMDVFETFYFDVKHMNQASFFLELMYLITVFCLLISHERYLFLNGECDVFKQVQCEGRRILDSDVCFILAVVVSKNSLQMPSFTV